MIYNVDTNTKIKVCFPNVQSYKLETKINRLKHTMKNKI